MARYVTTIESPWSVERAFGYMADLSNFQEWDPGVSSSRQVKGVEAGLGSEYDVAVSGTTLRYVVIEFAPARRVVAEAESTTLRSHDAIEVSSRDSGSAVTYDATVELKGPLKLLDPLFGLWFKRIGDKAAVGMADALEGTKVR